MSNKNVSHERALLIIGIFAVVFLVIITLFFNSVLGTTGKSALTQETTQATITSEGIGYDPLVTFVPDEYRGTTGIPQPLDSDPARGASTPVISIIEFGDFQCEVCAQMSSVMSSIVKKYPNQVRHYWKDFPLADQHEQAEEAAMAARCASEQGAFWEYHDKLFEYQDEFLLAPWNDIAISVGIDETAFATCLSTEKTKKVVTESYFTAKSLGIEEVPTYYIGDTQLSGLLTEAEISTIIDAAIAVGERNSENAGSTDTAN